MPRLDTGGGRFTSHPLTDDATEKRCSKCGTVKPVSDFYRCKGSYQTRCKACFKTPEALKLANEQTRKWREANPERWLDTQMRRYYGATAEQWISLLKAQVGRCAICNKPMERPHLDHNHKSGGIRGLLCGHCNMGLGHFGKEDPDLLRRAADYLEANE